MGVGTSCNVALLGNWVRWDSSFSWSVPNDCLLARDVLARGNRKQRLVVNDFLMA